MTQLNNNESVQEQFKTHTYRENEQKGGKRVFFRGCEIEATILCFIYIDDVLSTIRN